MELFEDFSLFRDICIICSTLAGTACMAVAFYLIKKVPF